jgi:hypothetical protein
MSSTDACPPDGSNTYKISYTGDLTDPAGAGGGLGAGVVAAGAGVVQEGGRALHTGSAREFRDRTVAAVILLRCGWRAGVGGVRGYWFGFFGFVLVWCTGGRVAGGVPGAVALSAG